MWQVKMETAELQQFDGFSAVGFRDSVYLFGGESLNGGDSNSVFRMHGDFQWDRWGTMSPSRTQFTALANDNYIVLIGSIGQLPVEYWKWNGENFTITKSRYTTDSWRSYPLAFFVEDGDFNET